VKGAIGLRLCAQNVKLYYMAVPYEF
jgi:hypothetical protein